MRHYHWYETSTGMLSGRTYADNIADEAAHAAALKANQPAGHSSIEGQYDHLSQRVDLEKLKAEDDAAATAWAAAKEASRLARTAGGQPGQDPPAPARTLATARHVVDYQPASPGSDHEWNPASRRWQLNAAGQQRRADLALAQALEGTQHSLVRRLALDPGDAAARAKLKALDEQIAGLTSTAGE